MDRAAEAALSPQPQLQPLCSARLPAPVSKSAQLHRTFDRRSIMCDRGMRRFCL